MFGGSGRPKRVVVAVVYDGERRAFFLVHNARWGGYALPTRPWRPEGLADPVRFRAVCEQTALEALAEDLGRPLPDAEPLWIDHLEVPGRSGRTGRRGLYVYDLVTVAPGEPLPAGGLAAPCGFLALDAALKSPLVTWTTQQVLRRLVGEQRVALGVVCRQGEGGREYLTTLSRHGGYFFPAARLRDYLTPIQALVGEFRLKTRFLGGIRVEECAIVELDQQTRHLGERHYFFHVCRVTFPGLDLTAPNNALEDALARAGILCRWVSEGQVANPPDWLSPTVTGLRKAVLALPCGA
jgi:hypothetical protein